MREPSLARISRLPGAIRSPEKDGRSYALSRDTALRGEFGGATRGPYARVMTITRQSPPHRGTEPLALQLDLFPPPTPMANADERGVSRDVARASISPGWWQHLAPLYNVYLGLVVEECHERDGELILRALDGDGAPVEEMVQRICESAERTCGACGAAPGAPYRARLEGPTRRVCVACRERLRNGESYLTIADDYWALDGSRRDTLRGGRGGARPTTAHPAPGAALPTEPLPAADLRRLVSDIRATMRSEIVGNDAGVSRLALLAGLHVGGGLSRGGRALILGPTGAGKSALVAAMLRGLAAFSLPVITIDCTDLNPPGWSGAPSIAQLIAHAIGCDSPASPRAQRAVVVLDELHHVMVGSDTTGNLAGFSKLIMSSLLGVTGHGTIQLEDAQSWSSQHALVLGLGAFTGLLDYRRPVTVRTLEEAGVHRELANRLAVDVVTVTPPTEREMVGILREWPDLRGLITICTRLGYDVRVHDEAIRRAARVVQLGHDHSTLRTAGGWLVSALRQGLTDALERSDSRAIAVTPDSLPIPAHATRPHVQPNPPELPGGDDGSNAWPTR